MNSTGASLPSPISDPLGGKMAYKQATPVQIAPAQTPPAVQPATAAPVTPAQKPEPVTVSNGKLTGSYEYDRQLHLMIVTLRRADNGEVIEQIPNEHIIKMLTSLMESVGNTLDVKS